MDIASFKQALLKFEWVSLARLRSAPLAAWQERRRSFWLIRLRRPVPPCAEKRAFMRLSGEFATSRPVNFTATEATTVQTYGGVLTTGFPGPSPARQPTRNSREASNKPTPPSEGPSGKSASASSLPGLCGNQRTTRASYCCHVGQPES